MGMPASMEMLPASMPPIMPINAMKQTAERATFSMITAVLQVSAEMMAQMKEMSFSPIFMLRGLASVTSTVLFVL